MPPEDYDAWYETARGRWIGDTEYRQLHRLLGAQRNDSILDAGCGTGWFTRRFSTHSGLEVTGVDLNANWLAHARSRDPQGHYVCADACLLPFADDSFERTLSMTALCFIEDWPRAMREIVRVTRSRFVIGLLNRHGLLWREKGQDDPNSSYCGAHWHSVPEVRSTLAALPVRGVQFHSAVFLPSASAMARMAEQVLPNSLTWGSCLFVSGNVKAG
ncbi:class I SAM-dependent methyltransferase [Formivibrio citricus]|nr:class I SAM-dependent methyltransferase [Formivibrio citricus]